MSGNAALLITIAAFLLPQAAMLAWAMFTPNED
jgi:hypothetical protein